MVGPHPAFEGPAVVERSTTDDLVLYFEPARTKTGAGGAAGSQGTSAASGYHAVISQWSPLPILPVGAQLWLVKNPDGNQALWRAIGGPDPFTLAIWDRQGGTLLLEATYGAPLTRTPDCTTWTKLCEPAMVTYHKVTVPADSPTILADGASAVIQRAGRPYDVHVTSRTTPAQLYAYPMCADYRQVDASSLDLKVRDLSGISFDRGTPPACIEGNDRIENVYLSTDNPYQGLVTYRGRDASRLRFETSAGKEVALSPASAIVEPAVGQQFWFSGDYKLAVLRTSETGPLVAATVALDLSSADMVGAALGVSFTVEKDCAYTSETAQPGSIRYLQRVVLGATPSVTVHSGAEVQATIDGKAFRVSNHRGRFVLR
jgi:hypothetical protein